MRGELVQPRPARLVVPQVGRASLLRSRIAQHDLVFVELTGFGQNGSADTLVRCLAGRSARAPLHLVLPHHMHRPRVVLRRPRLHKHVHMVAVLGVGAFEVAIVILQRRPFRATLRPRRVLNGNVMPRDAHMPLLVIPRLTLRLGRLRQVILRGGGRFVRGGINRRLGDLETGRFGDASALRPRKHLRHRRRTNLTRLRQRIRAHGPLFAGIQNARQSVWQIFSASKRRNNTLSFASLKDFHRGSRDDRSLKSCHADA